MITTGVTSSCATFAVCLPYTTTAVQLVKRAIKIYRRAAEGNGICIYTDTQTLQYSKGVLCQLSNMQHVVVCCGGMLVIVPQTGLGQPDVQS